MSEDLVALFEGRRVGRMTYNKDRLTFQYDDRWQDDPAAFPLSLSMPLNAREHPDGVTRPFVSGLLPDDNEVLRRWGQKFQVSPRNPFRLLQCVGEECAGAVQFVQPDRASHWLADEAPERVTWLDEDEFVERIQELVADRSRVRRLGDEGHFSLAGAQAKTGLYLDEAKKRWGVPEGVTPTTHILKPNTGGFDGYEKNEHFCLRLAGHIGLAAAKSWTEVIGGTAVIVVERFDRIPRDGRIVRVHQEDMCQALARMPERKYQNEGGPSALEIFELIRNHSAKPQDDVLRFLDAMIFNYLIWGTDAHAKNYGFLLASGGQVRLTRLYDLSSCIPYPLDIPPRKAKLAMKIGGEYQLHRIGVRHWERAAAEWKLDRDLVFKHLIVQAEKLPAAAEEIANVGTQANDILNRLVDGISESAKACTKTFS
jgi:serine/threonine-protein kinase HipA